MKENFFDVLSKDASDLEGQVQARFVLAGLNGIDALAGHAYGVGKVSLRPFLLSSQNTKAGLHSWYRQENRIRTMLHRVIISAGRSSEAPSRNPNRCSRTKISVSAKEPTPEGSRDQDNADCHQHSLLRGWMHVRSLLLLTDVQSLWPVC
jgi:hypothetical protein